MATVASIVAANYYKANIFAAAMRFFAKSLRIHEICSIDRERDLVVADHLFQVGICSHALGNFSQAIALYKSSFKIKERCLLFYESDGMVAATLFNIGVCYFNQGDRNAIEYLHKALEIRARIPITASTTHLKMFLNPQSLAGVSEESFALLPQVADADPKQSIIKTDVIVGAYFFIAQFMTQTKSITAALDSFAQALKALNQTHENTDTDAAAMTTIIQNCIN